MNFDNLQYQSFPDQPGMVDSQKKLEAFRLPPLSGKSFFDIGCNEGFYCGYALSQGAKSVVGLDSYPAFIERAKKRFPDARFITKSWTDPFPEESFDVILFASTMHYIDDEEKIVALFKAVAEKMTPKSVFVVETGINPKKGEWLNVTRHNNTCVFYPSIDIFERIAVKSGLVYRVVGESEPGDGINRTVIHLSRFYTPLTFISGKSGVGKTRLCYSLNGNNLETIVNIDHEVASIYFEKYGEFNRIKQNPLDLLFLKLEKEIATRLIVDHLDLIIRKKIDELVRSDFPTKSLLIDGLDQDNKNHQYVKTLLLIRFGGKHPIWTAFREI